MISKGNCAMLIRIYAVLCVLIGLCSGADDLNATIEWLFNNMENKDPIGVLVPSPSPKTEVQLKNSTNSCGPGKKCIQSYLCSNGRKKTGGDITLFNPRFSIVEDSNCQFLETCCIVDDSIATPSIVTPTETPKKCGFRNKNGIGITINDATSEAEFGEFPWMLAVLRGKDDLDKDRETYQCGGSLIHPQVALTTAHCVYGKLPIAFKVRAGEWESNTKNEPLPEQNIDVIDMAIHPQYNQATLYNDIAMLFLASPFKLEPHINTICLPPPGFNFDLTKCFATGWGKDKFRNGNFQNILKKIELPVVPNNICQDNMRKTILGEYFELDPSFLCAGGERDKDTCEGDGGSPLVCPIDKDTNNYYQAGIVAWGIECGKENIPGVYVNVAKFRRWIDEELALRQLVSPGYIPR